MTEETIRSNDNLKDCFICQVRNGESYLINRKSGQSVIVCHTCMTSLISLNIVMGQVSDPVYFVK